ncbi:MAG TPA: hypothetical protein VGM92_15780 [Candidatus Kapabacteria bacterium]
MDKNVPQSEAQNAAPQAGGEPVRAEKKRTFWGRTRKVLALLLLFLLIFFFAAGLFIQLPIFKRLVINELVSAVESSTNGTLSVGKIRGNILEGFVMEDVSLRLKTGTRYDSIPLVHVDKILASYSLWRWLKTNEIGVTSMTLEHPVVRFVKFQGDTTWNFSLLTKPVPAAPAGPSKPFTQVIDLSRFQIQNGSFYMRDYNFAPKQEAALKAKSASEAEPAIDWSDVEAEEIDLDSRFYARGGAMQSARVHHLRFIEKKSGFFVSHLQFTGYLDSVQAKMEDAKITTGHSAIGFAVDIARPKDSVVLSALQHSKVDVSLKGPVISSAELKQFLPKPLGFLGSSPGIDLEATGEFGKLKIKHLDLDFHNQGNISIAGELDNLHHPDSLTMNVAIQARNLSNATLDDYVPGLHLPNLSRFGTINISSLTYAGAPLNFHTKFAAKSSGAGDVSGDVALDLRNHAMRYRAGVKTANFNVAALVPGDDYESSITAEAQLAGHGTNWKTMASSITVKTDGPSTFGDYKVQTLDLVGAIDRGTFTTDRLDAEMDGGPSVHVTSAMLGLTSESLPFRFDGTVNNLLLGDFVTSQELNPARVDVTANVAGSARNLEDVTGTAHARLYDLEYSGHALPEDSLDVSMQAGTADDNKLSIRSAMADIDIEHRFRTGDLLNVLPSRVRVLLDAVGKRNFPVFSATEPSIANCSDSLDFDYALNVKDLRPLADFLPQTFLLAQGKIDGNVHGCRKGDISLAMNGDSVSFVLRDRMDVDTDLVESFDTTRDTGMTLLSDSGRTGTIRIRMHRRDSSALALPKFEGAVPRIQAQPTSFHLLLNHLSNDSARVLEHLDASLDLSTDSVLRLGSALLYDPKISMTYRNEALNFSVASNYNNELDLHLVGNALFPNGDLSVTLDSLDVTYSNPYFTPANNELRRYIWRNETPAHLLIAKNGLVRIDSLNIEHPLKDYSHNPPEQEMSLGGTIAHDTIDAWASFPSINLKDLKAILPFNPNAKTFDFTSYNGKIRNFQASLQGTLENPAFKTRLFIDSMTYGNDGENRITFDSNSVELSYKNEQLQGSMRLHVDSLTSSTPNGGVASSGSGSQLTATIESIPMVIAFERGPNYAADSARTASAPIAASIRATQFPLDVATPFLPPFREVLGTGDIDFTISGTRNNIQYAGQAFIRNGELLLAATNIWYLFGGPITFAHNALVLQNDSVRNISSDDPNGSASLNGSFTFNGFDITNFDLRLRSDGIMVLSDAAKESLPLAYGPVTISTGGEDFHFYNTFEAPKISGTIDILAANVTMPSTSNESQTVSDQGVIYEAIPRVVPVTTQADTVHLVGHPDFSPVASTRSAMPDDTLFPNAMKDIYRNDDGTEQATVTEPSATAPSQENLLAPSFAEKLRMDLTVNTQGTAQITIPFAGNAFGGILNTELKADLKPGGTLNIVRGDDLALNADGFFDLTPNSTFSFLQTFTISSGRVSFLHDLTNPNIDITADYIGTHHKSDGSSDQAKIEIDVKGSKNHPELYIYNYEQKNGVDFELRPEPNTTAAQEDAIYFLGTGGYFKSDLSGNNTALGNLLPSIGGQLTANILSDLTGSTTNLVAIRSASYDWGTKGAQLTAEVHDVTLKLATGYPTVGPNNTGAGNYGLSTIETDIPLSLFVTKEWAHDFMIQLQANPNPSGSTNAALTQQPTFLSKVVWTGINF